MTKRPIPFARRLVTLAGTLLLAIAFTSQSPARQPTAFPLITDRGDLPLSDRFDEPSRVGIASNGDVFFRPESRTAIFHWDRSTGTRRRIIQAGDPQPGVPRSVLDLVGEFFTPGPSGSVAMVNTVTQAGAPEQPGIFLYDGTGFTTVMLAGQPAPGTGELFSDRPLVIHLNSRDQVAFQGVFGPIGIDSSGLFLWSRTSGSMVKLALIGETAPTGGTYQNLSIIGLNNAGEVAFVADLAGGRAARAIFVATSAGITAYRCRRPAAMISFFMPSGREDASHYSPNPSIPASDAPHASRDRAIRHPE